MVLGGVAGKDVQFHILECLMILNDIIKGINIEVLLGIFSSAHA